MRTYTQKEIYDYLCANPLGTAVHVGNLEDMNGSDYIFLDYFQDIAMLRDDSADYQTILQISVLTRDYEDRKALVNYIQDEFLSAPTYSRNITYEYYQAQFNIGVFIHSEQII